MLGVLVEGGPPKGFMCNHLRVAWLNVPPYSNEVDNLRPYSNEVDNLSPYSNEVDNLTDNSSRSGIVEGKGILLNV